MCFSATTSFIASAALLTIGAASVRYIKAPASIPLAIIPLIFSVQQFCEGILWLSMTRAAFTGWKIPATYTFLSLAEVAWPVWVPLSFLLIERVTNRKRILSLLLCIGLLVSTYALRGLAHYPVEIAIGPRHIYYHVDFPYHQSLLTGIFYFIPTVLPAFVSGVRKVWIMAVILLLAYIISKLYFEDYVISIWCFFSALISAIIYLILRDLSAKKASVKVALVD